MDLSEVELARFRTRLCSDHKTGTCVEGDRCPNSHCISWQRRNPYEFSYSPQLCPDIDFLKTGSKMSLLRRCNRGRACIFAHSKEEELYHPIAYKTKPCSRYPNCHRAYCPFAHSAAELRPSDPTPLALQLASIRPRGRPPTFSPPKSQRFVAPLVRPAVANGGISGKDEHDLRQIVLKTFMTTQPSGSNDFQKPSYHQQTVGYTAVPTTDKSMSKQQVDKIVDVSLQVVQCILSATRQYTGGYDPSYPIVSQAISNPNIPRPPLKESGAIVPPAFDALPSGASAVNRWIWDAPTRGGSPTASATATTADLFLRGCTPYSPSRCPTTDTKYRKNAPFTKKWKPPQARSSKIGSFSAATGTSPTPLQYYQHPPAPLAQSTMAVCQVGTRPIAQSRDTREADDDYDQIWMEISQAFSSVSS